MIDNVHWTELKEMIEQIGKGYAPSGNAE